MFAKLSLRTKLLFLCGTLLFFTVAVGGVSYWGINKVVKSYNRVADTSLPKIKELDSMYLYYRQIRINLRTLGLPGLTPEQQKEAITKTLEGIENYEKADAKFISEGFIPGEKALYEVVDKNWDNFKSIGVKVLDLQKVGTPEAHAKMVEIFLKDCPEAAALYTTSINAIEDFHTHTSNLWVKESHDDADFVSQVQGLIVLFSVIGGLVVGYFFAASISKLLQEISTSLSQGSDKISTISGEISSASTNLSSSIIQQAAALQETTSAVEQTSASVVSNADNAKKSTEVSEHSKESVHSGKKAVEEVMTSIGEISESMEMIKKEIDESNKEIAGIVNIINEIGTKTKVINEIVFQTKLLSFNASVEAARAGEHGKGFAVVAEEVGNLAAMSGKSAKEITDLLLASTERVQATVENSKRRINSLMESSRGKVEQGTFTAKKCSDALDEITSNVSNVNMMISEISSASNEQSLSIREITKAMSEIDSASHQNSSSSQQATEATVHLGSQVDDFRELVVRLNTFIEGKKSA